MRKLALTTALLLSLSIPSLAQTHKVVIDVNTILSDGWAQATFTARMLLNTFGHGNVQVEVVSRGPGIAMMMKTDTEFSDKIATLSRDGVRFAVCQQTLTASRSRREDLLPGVELVDSGAAELVRKQEAGWAYLK